MKKGLLSVIFVSTILLSINNLSQVNNDDLSFDESKTINCSNDINYLVNGDDTDIAISPTPNLPPITDPGSDDESTSFNDAVNINLDSSVNGDFQSSDDVDYFYYYGEYTNYIRFNVLCTNSLVYTCKINVYQENDLENPLYSYNNSSTYAGDNLDLFEPMLVNQGEIYYFEVYQTGKRDATPVEEVDQLAIQLTYYTAQVLSANEADCDPSEFRQNGYISSRYPVYNGSDNIFCFLDTSLNYSVTSDYTYKDAIIEAMSIWNGVGKKQFWAVDSEKDADILIYAERDETSGHSGEATAIDYDNSNVYTRKVTLNKYFFEEVCNKYSQENHEARLMKTSLHELGHCLGFGDLTNNSNIMYDTNIPLRILGTFDIALYRYLWG